MIMGAKLANPDAVCLNVMGDASIGMVGMDIETAVRNRIGIITLVFNNGMMAGERLGMDRAIDRVQRDRPRRRLPRRRGGPRGVVEADRADRRLLPAAREALDVTARRAARRSSK